MSENHTRIRAAIDDDDDGEEEAYALVGEAICHLPHGISIGNLRGLEQFRPTPTLAQS